jgi:hypothetical protein
VLDARGERHYGYDAVTVVAGASPILKCFVPVLQIQTLRWFGERIYCYVATHRRTSCELPRRALLKAGIFGKWQAAADVLLASVIAYVFLLNLSTIPRLGITIPEIARAPANMMGLDQVWNMFAPFPAKDDGWYVIPGKLRNGNVVDLFRSGKEVDFTKPAYASLEFKNHRWRKYMDLMRKRAPLQPIYARYLCREWNRRHTGGQMLDELEVIYVLEWTQPSSDYSPIAKQSVIKFTCPA